MSRAFYWLVLVGVMSVSGAFAAETRLPSQPGQAGAVSGQAVPPVRPAPGPVNPLQTFQPDQIDRNGDGLIARAELEALRAEQWPTIDRDRDGQLSKPELVGKFQRPFDARGDRYFAGLDHDRNGRLSVTEVQGEISLWFGRFDLSKDGLVDQLELLSGLANVQNGRFGQVF